MKNKNILVSVIIPTYKRPGMLERAIDSCLNQTYDNIEILVIDDNNPKTIERKETEKFMKKYQNNHKVKYIKREKNGGGCQSRNTGINEAKGQYICFLDDDDFYFKNKIEKQLIFMVENELDVSFCGSQTYDETKGKIIKEQKHTNFEKYDSILNYHLVEMIVSPQTFMYKKEVLQKIKGFDDVPAGQEYCLMYKTIINGYKISCLHDILVCICIHSGDRITTSKKKLEAEKFLYQIKRKHFSNLNYSQKRYIKYIYKHNIWRKYKSSKSIKQYIYLLYIMLSHPIILIKRKCIHEKN